jgi:hypothetical protein
MPLLGYSAEFNLVLMLLSYKFVLRFSFSFLCVMHLLRKNFSQREHKRKFKFARTGGAAKLFLRKHSNTQLFFKKEDEAMWHE